MTGRRRSVLVPCVAYGCGALVHRELVPDALCHRHRGSQRVEAEIAAARQGSDKGPR